MGESKGSMKVNLHADESKERMRLDRIPYRHWWMVILQDYKQALTKRIL